MAVLYGIRKRKGVGIMDKEENIEEGYAQVFKEDEYIAIKWSEYKELLITKGKYEELSKQKEPLIQYIPNIQPLTTPYPADLTKTYQTEITCNNDVPRGRNIEGKLC